MEEKLTVLKARLREIDDIESAAGVLHWDQSTYMPAAGAGARGRQMATLARLSHEKFIGPEIGKLLDDLGPYADELSYDDDDASLIRVTRRDYDQATKVPPDFIAELYAHMSESYAVWAKARPENDFAAVQPNLEKTLDLSRRFAEYFPGYDHIADPLIDQFDYGMKAATVSALFAELRGHLVPLVQAISEQAPLDDTMLRLNFLEDRQLAFGNRVIKKYGYDFNRGRQDKTVHPFMIKFSIDDVRITTRVNENYIADALFSTLHECGHALYELGLDHAFEGLPLASGTSSGLHESQSRLWENQVGRSRLFWDHFYPELQETFPEQLRDVSADSFYRAVNKVERSLIRTDADEVTYNLHVMIRFDLELAMLEGKLQVKDLPDAWHARYESDLGLRAPDNSDGVMQDVHWYGGIIGGAFQGYTLGNIMSALFFEAAIDAHPEIPAEIGNGEFGALHNWLKQNLYQHGRKYTAAELVERVTGNPLTISPYINYLKKKYGELYQL